MAELRSTDIIRKCGDLVDFWSVRKTQLGKWYDVLLLTNNLEQEGMESVIANDPRVGHNMALHLLTDSTIAHKIPTEELEKPEVVDTSYLEGYVTKQWASMEQQQRSIGKQSWLREFIGLMLATGWYSIFAWATKDKLIAEVWNPAEVYPKYSRDPDIGLLELAHVYPLPAAEANRKAKISGWALPRPFRGDVKIYNYWFIDDDGDCANALVMGNVLVIPAHKMAKNEQASIRIPVFTSPVGGLPDTGIIKTGKDWQKNYGESLIAANVDEFNNHNKMLSYVQQLVRDTANPRWLERSTSSRGILRPEDIFKRGAIFRAGPNDTVEPLATPPIPVELRTILFDYDNRIQRGLFPNTLYGNIQGQMSGYMMAQIASTAMGVLTPYAEAIKAVLAGVDNYWWNEVRERNLKPTGFEMPANIPPDIAFVVDLNMNIPGNLIQRATVGRMLNPNLKFDFATTCDMLFPEIRNPVAIQGKVNREEAMMGEVAQMVSLIGAYREVARMATEEGDDATASLYAKAAAAIESQIDAMGAGPPTAKPPTTRRGAPPMPAEFREAIPREETAAPGGVVE